MTEIYRAIKYLVEPIRALCRMFSFSFSNTPEEEVNIPSVEGYEIKSLERCLSHGQGERGNAPTIKMDLS